MTKPDRPPASMTSPDLIGAVNEVTDGAPVARFMVRQHDPMERGNGLLGSR